MQGSTNDYHIQIRVKESKSELDLVLKHYRDIGNIGHHYYEYLNGDISEEELINVNKRFYHFTRYVTLRIYDNNSDLLKKYRIYIHNNNGDDVYKLGCCEYINLDLIDDIKNNIGNNLKFSGFIHNDNLCICIDDYNRKVEYGNFYREKYILREKVMTKSARFFH
jgi:hypothetical protein